MAAGFEYGRYSDSQPGRSVAEIADRRRSSISPSARSTAVLRRFGNSQVLTEN